MRRKQMQRNKRRFSTSHNKKRSKTQQGVALITTLLLLMLMTGLSLAMVLSVRSDMLINGYYRNFRGSFYAADSGLNVARQAMLDQVIAAIPASFTITQQPIPNGTDTNVQNFLVNTYGQNFVKLTGNGNAGSSWPGSFKLTNASFTFVSCGVQGGNKGATCAAPSGPITEYDYQYNYSLTAQGQAQGTQATTISDRGSVLVKATLVPTNSKISFAAWGMFIDHSPECDGTTLVPGTISGPVFTNGAWNFGTSGSYIFTDTVGSVASTSGYQFSGTCKQVAGDVPVTSGKSTIDPQFQAGVQQGQPAVALPSNDFNQQRAVLDGIGADTSPVSKSDLHNALKDVTGNPYPSSGTNSGVFLPYTQKDGDNTIDGGGIYVEGSASVTLSAPNGTSQQVYTIKQGNPATTTTVVINPTGGKNGNGTTTVTTQVGGLPVSAPVIFQGVPQQIDPATHASSPATMLYVDGSITSLSGPGQGIPAIQNGSEVTITAANNVTVTGDILYTTEPVTTSPDPTTGLPADSLIPGNDTRQALGIYTATGDIQLNNQQANNNLEIDASLATISQNGTGGLTNIGNQINQLTIVGGRIQNNIKNINAKTRNVFFDRRYAQGGFAPPWFPSTSLTLGGVASAKATTTVQRLQWVNQTSYY
jgi:Tfp pilus assembly protein PilX